MPEQFVQLDQQSRDLTCAFNPDRTCAITGVIGKTVPVWDLASGRRVRELTGHTDRIWGLAWNQHDPRFVLTGSWDHTARLWNVDSGECERVLEGHRDTIRTVEFSADYRRVLSAAHDKTVRVWDVASGQRLEVFEGRTPFLNASWLPDGKGIVACDERMAPTAGPEGRGLLHLDQTSRRSIQRRGAS